MDKIIKIASVSFLFIFFIVFLGLFFRSTTKITKQDINETESYDTLIIDTDIEGEETIQETPNSKYWKHSESIDEMTETTNTWGYIESDNTVYFDFPYEGGTTLKIIIRYMKKFGTNVLLKSTQGQIIGEEFQNNNYIIVKFDNNQPKKYYFNKPNDGDSKCIFLINSTDFINKCKSAKNIKIEMTFYKEGNRIFNFNVDEPYSKNNN